MTEPKQLQVGALPLDGGAWLVVSLPTSLLLEAVRASGVMGSPFEINRVTFELRKEQKR